MDNIVNNDLLKAVQDFWQMLDKLYIVIFIITSGIINMYMKADNKAPWLNWLRKIPAALWVFIYGIILGTMIYWLKGYAGKEKIAGIIFSLFISMGIYKLGISMVFKWFAKNILKINFNTDDPGTPERTN